MGWIFWNGALNKGIYNVVFFSVLTSRSCFKITNKSWVPSKIVWRKVIWELAEFNKRMNDKWKTIKILSCIGRKDSLLSFENGWILSGFEPVESQRNSQPLLSRRRERWKLVDQIRRRKQQQVDQFRRAEETWWDSTSQLLFCFAKFSRSSDVESGCSSGLDRHWETVGTFSSCGEKLVFKI